MTSLLIPGKSPPPYSDPAPQTGHPERSAALHGTASVQAPFSPAARRKAARRGCRPVYRCRFPFRTLPGPDRRGKAPCRHRSAPLRAQHCFGHCLSKAPDRVPAIRPCSCVLCLNIQIILSHLTKHARYKALLPEKFYQVSICRTQQDP